jgi:cysteine synthase B
VRESIADVIGKTPLVKLTKLTPETGAKVLAKAEFLNPGGSIKDRPVLNIIRDAEKQGILHKGKTILDATSGNAGISYAMIGASEHYKVELCIPSNVTIERKRILEAFGAKLFFTDALEGTDGAITAAAKLYKTYPRKYFYGDQYSNEANWKAHYVSTASEILSQTKGKVTHFVAGVGTSGTLMGVGKKLREFDSKIQIIEVQPSSPLHGIEGLKRMDSAIKPGIYDSGFADKTIEVETEDAQSMVLQLASREAMLTGTSSGANLVATLKVAKKVKNGVAVTVLPDGADRYFSDAYWQQVKQTRN